MEKKLKKKKKKKKRTKEEYDKLGRSQMWNGRNIEKT